MLTLYVEALRVKNKINYSQVNRNTLYAVVHCLFQDNREIL